jgi:hypothetical protein
VHDCDEQRGNRDYHAANRGPRRDLREAQHLTRLSIVIAAL